MPLYSFDSCSDCAGEGVAAPRPSFFNFHSNSIALSLPRSLFWQLQTCKGVAAWRDLFWQASNRFMAGLLITSPPSPSHRSSLYDWFFQLGNCFVSLVWRTLFVDKSYLVYIVGYRLDFHFHINGENFMYSLSNYVL